MWLLWSCMDCPSWELIRRRGRPKPTPRVQMKRCRLRSDELQLDGFKVRHVPADTAPGVEQDERFGRERIAQRGDPEPVNDGVALAEVAEGYRQRASSDRLHVGRL